jgi:hypothetical protein
MAIVQKADVEAYVKACGLPIPPALATLVSLARAAAERALFDYLGYDPQRNTVIEYLPHGTGNNRGDGDASSAGFDMTPSGMVVSRGVGRVARLEMVLTQLPVLSITSVYDNAAAWNVAGGDWPASSLLPANTYWLDAPTQGGKVWSGIVYRNAGSWNTVPRSIRVTYESGLTPEELAEDGTYPNFRMAVLTAAAVKLGKIIAQGRVALTGHIVSSVSIEDFAASFGGVGGTSLGSADGVGIAGTEFPTEAKMWVKRYRHPAALV